MQYIQAQARPTIEINFFFAHISRHSQGCSYGIGGCKFEPPAAINILVEQLIKKIFWAGAGPG